MTFRPLSEIRFVVVHHSVTPGDWTVDDLRHIHKILGYSDIGYHFVVNHDGMKVGRSIYRRGAHAISEKPPYLGIDMNRAGIGICLVGDFSGHPPDDKLINEVAYAIVRIAKKFDIPINREHIIGHRDVSFTVCPGPKTMPAIYRKLKIH